MSENLTLESEIVVERKEIAPLCSSDLLECLSQRQKYYREYYKKNRAKKLAQARLQKKYPEPIKKTCVICGGVFECGGPNAKRSPKAITCGDDCQKEYRPKKNAEYIKANYERVRAKDNETHKNKRNNPEYRNAEYAKNRTRMKSYRQNPIWRAREKAKNKIWQREYRKTTKWEQCRRAYLPKHRMNAQKHRSRKMGAIRLMQMLATAKKITNQ